MTESKQESFFVESGGYIEFKDEENQKKCMRLIQELVAQAKREAVEEERERIKRCLMPVVDLDKCGHEEGSMSVADNLGQYHVASGACRNCGMSMLDWDESQKESK